VVSGGDLLDCSGGADLAGDRGVIPTGRRQTRGVKRPPIKSPRFTRLGVGHAASGGQSRAFLLQLDSVRKEIGSLHDPRAARLVEPIDHSLREPAEPGTLRHVEREASELLRSLRVGEA
jgi:hypothetical protein